MIQLDGGATEKAIVLDVLGFFHPFSLQMVPFNASLGKNRSDQLEERPGRFLHSLIGDPFLNSGAMAPYKNLQQKGPILWFCRMCRL